MAAVLFAAALVADSRTIVNAQRNGPKGGCATIQHGTLQDSFGNLLVVGFDEFGYNYQSHEFNGTYDRSDRSAATTACSTRCRRPGWGSTDGWTD